MGFGDKLKGLAKQAQDAAAEHKDQIKDAVDAASLAVDQKTHGKYTAKIIRANEKAGAAIGKLGADGDEAAVAGQAPSGAAPSEPAPPFPSTPADGGGAGDPEHAHDEGPHSDDGGPHFDDGPHFADPAPAADAGSSADSGSGSADSGSSSDSGPSFDSGPSDPGPSFS